MARDRFKGLSPDSQAELQAKLASFEQRLRELERKPGRAGIITRDTAVRPGDLLNIEAPDDGLTVQLPQATQQLRNARVTLAFRNTNPVRIICARGTVNREAFVINTSIGTFEAVCDGLGGWAVETGLTSGGSAVDAQYVLGAAHASLPNGAVATDTAEINVTVTPGGAATWSLIDGSVVLERLEDIPGLSLLGRSPNSAGPVAPITADTIRHVARDSDDGTFLEWGYPCALLLNGVSPFIPEAFYSSKVLNSDWNMTQSPSALYVASLDTTFVAWCAVGLAGDKASQIAAYDHATNTWSRRYNAGNYTLANDDHGHPAICRDSSGYFHLFYGSHASVQHLSSSNSPDDITAWTQHTPLSGTQTYPHPCTVGSSIYLFLRNDAVLTRRQMLVRSASLSAGVPTFGASTNIIDFDADSRVYTSEAYVVGTDVHFVCTRADGNDTSRQHVYYFVYKTATGAVENHDGSFSTASGSLPVGLTSANTNYRLIDYGSDKGEVPSLAFDSSGDPHVQYIQGTDAGGYTLKHIKRTSGTWSSPATVATITDQVPGSGTGQGFVDIHGLVAGASGTMQSWYQNNAGDKLRRVRSAAGVWGTEEVILDATSLRLMGQQAVRDADPSFRAIFSEVSTSSLDASSVAGSRYAYGDSGPVNVAMPAAGSSDSLWTSVQIMLGFDHRDASTLIINESDSAAVVTAVGNAQVDTAQAKFGSASLLLDGTGDYLSLVSNSLYSVSNGDFTVECWVRRNASKLQCIVGKRPGTGATEWAFYLNATTNVLILQAYATSLVLNITGTTGLTTGWHHVAASRAGTTWRCFLDGALEASGTESATPTGNSELLLIGRDASNTARDFNGWIDDFRFTSGNARYTAAFTAPTAAFPRI